MSNINPTPDLPLKDRFAFIDSSTKVATPDLIQFDEENLPIELITNLLFEKVGGKELINIARNDLVNGQTVSYSLIGNLTGLQRLFGPRNMFQLSGTSEEFFSNFAIKYKVHVPENGTAPAKYYVGPEDSNGCGGSTPYPVLNRYDNSLEGCFVSFTEAQNHIEETYPLRDIVYSDPETGDIVIDVINMQTNEKIQIEAETSGALEDDTIY
jgi:hypothetical protein